LYTKNRHCYDTSYIIWDNFQVYNKIPGRNCRCDPTLVHV
jgi:hypothetical protein